MLDSVLRHRLALVILGRFPARTQIHLAPDTSVIGAHGHLAHHLRATRFRHSTSDHETEPAAPNPPTTTTTTPTGAITRALTPNDPDPAQATSPEETADHSSPPSRTAEEQPDPEFLDPEPADDDARQETTQARPTLFILDIFGPLRLRFTSTEPTETEISLSDRKRDLLLYLASHRDGAHRDTITDELWPDSTGHRRPTKLLNTALTRLRATLTEATDGAPDPIRTTGDGRYKLDPELIDVDYWRFIDAIRRARDSTTEDARVEAYREALTAYHGDLGDRHEAPWLAIERQEALTDAVESAHRLAQHARPSRPYEAIAILEHAIEIAPYEESLYRYVAEVQRESGQAGKAERTMQKLDVRLSSD